ncbi:unnamed protein product [Prorocentrum cordatum]|uniref:Uncharacterized protein n=1 Tax=Prorocentrum cordatum TaxID=2364126 RepID=A0ABN9RSF9_9DINO|nr:unnamed protein product [Polarella glacialis]
MRNRTRREEREKQGEVGERGDARQHMGGSTPGVPRRPALPSGGHRQMRWTAGRQDPPPCPEARAGFALEASVLEEEEEEEEVKNEEGGGGERRRKHITTAAHDCKTLGSNCHHHLRGKAEANERREWAAWLPARRPAGRSAARRRRERPLRRYPPSGGFHALGAPRPCAGRAA